MAGTKMAQTQRSRLRGRDYDMEAFEKDVSGYLLGCYYYLTI